MTRGEAIYEAPTRTLLVLLPPGVPPEREHVVEDAALRGTRVEEGPVEQVAYVFLGGVAEAQAALPILQARDLEVRAIGSDGEEVVLSGGRRAGEELRQEREEVAPALPERVGDLGAARPGAPGAEPTSAETRRANVVARYALGLGLLSFCCVSLAGVLAMPVGMVALAHADPPHAVAAKVGIGLGALGLLLSLVGLLA